MTSPTKSATLKKRIHSGETVIGVSAPMTLERGSLETLMEKGSYDFVSVDSQHNPHNEERLVAFCEMAAEIGVHVQFRIKHTRHTYLVGNYLDLGPAGVEIPQVESEETAAEAVANFYYPETGVRSWGGSKRLGIGGWAEPREYARWWAETGVLWLQVESVESVTKVRKLAMPGVDCISFGPRDLIFSLDAHPNHPFKTVDDCVRHVAQELEGSDVAVCYRNNRPDTRQQYIDMGVTVLLEVGRI